MSARKFRNTWWVDVTLGVTRYRKRSPVNTQEGAEAFERRLRDAHALGEDVEKLFEQPQRSIIRPRGPTFAEFSARWFETYVKVNNKPSEQQAKTAALRLHLLPAFGPKQLADISTLAVEDFKAEAHTKGLSPKTINNILSILQKCLRCAVEWGDLASLPRIRPLKTNVPGFDFLSADEGNKLVEACPNERIRAQVLLALRTGMRIGEILGLEWQHVDLEHRLITVKQSLVKGILGSPKSGRPRYIPLTDEVMAALAALRGCTGYVFRVRGGHPRTYEMAYKALRGVCDCAGIRRIGWHVLRHSFASQLAGASVPMPAVQQLLGHSTINMTMRYAHVAPSILRDAVSVLDRIAQEARLRQHLRQHSPISVPA